jgi:hypothetical protein
VHKVGDPDKISKYSSARSRKADEQNVLNQQDYQAAHVMHLRQHLQQIQSL